MHTIHSDTYHGRDLPRAWRESTPLQRALILSRFKRTGELPLWASTDLHRLLTELRQTGGAGLYPTPNGGRRILPSVYTTLRTTWLKANGVWVSPSEMHSSHIENCLALLRESHNNLQGRAAELLGKMAKHFRNDPATVESLTAALKNLEVADISTVYPIFDVLAEELTRRPKQEIEISSEWDYL